MCTGGREAEPVAAMTKLVAVATATVVAAAVGKTARDWWLGAFASALVCICWKRPRPLASMLAVAELTAVVAVVVTTAVVETACTLLTLDVTSNGVLWLCLAQLLC